MTTPTGTIKASDIRNEFGASGPNNSVSLGNYRVKQTVSGLNDLPLDTGVPLPGSTISFDNLRGKKLNIVVDCTPTVYSFNRLLNGSIQHFYETYKTVPGYTVEESNYFQTYVQQVQGTVPLWRAYYQPTGGHLFTSDQNEYNQLGSGWVKEGNVGYVYPSAVPNSKPIRRASRSPYDWLLTTSEVEAQNAAGYTYEGIKFHTPTIIGSSTAKVNAKSNYDNNTSITYIGNFASKPASTAGKRVIIHTNGPIGSDQKSSTRTYCSLLTGSWDAAADLYIDIGPNGAVYGAGGDGGKGADVYQPNGGSTITGATDGGPGTSALGIILTNNTIINNRGSIISGNGGGGGGGGAAARTKRRGKDDNTACGGGGGGGGAGYPGGAGGKGGVASHVENGDILSGQNGEGGSLTSGGNGGAGYYSESGGRAAAGGGGGGAPGGLGGDAIEEISYPIYDENGEVIGYDVIDTGARKGSKASSTSGKGGNGSGTNGSSSGANGGSNGYAIVVNGSMPNITGNGTITGDKLPNTNPT